MPDRGKSLHNCHHAGVSTGTAVPPKENKPTLLQYILGWGRGEKELPIISPSGGAVPHCWRVGGTLSSVGHVTKGTMSRDFRHIFYFVIKLYLIKKQKRFGVKKKFRINIQELARQQVVCYVVFLAYIDTISQMDCILVHTSVRRGYLKKSLP